MEEIFDNFAPPTLRIYYEDVWRISFAFFDWKENKHRYEEA